MERFKKIILPMQGHNKSDLHWLYNTKSDDEPPKIFKYGSLKFSFGGVSYRNTEKMFLYVQIPRVLLCEECLVDSLPCETYLLHVISPVVKECSMSYQNINKSAREKAQFEAQFADARFIRRSGIQYMAEDNAFLLRINFSVPLVNALSVNAKAAVRAVRVILEHIETALQGISAQELKDYISTYCRQQEIRAYMKKHDLCSFVANGSILPRENGTSLPMKNAVPFVSPCETETTIPLSDGTKITGMGIKRGITVITGGGYSGKSTMLDAIETGIYDRTPGDGREYVLTDGSALKIYAEDGRPVTKTDLSPFFKYLPGGGDLTEFTTAHASGSVSQASNIVEAVCGKCSLLLIDEDKTATNFMIRDKAMRRIVKNEPIIPFTDRVRELFREKDVSTILVIGGSSEYLSRADTVILMEDYLPHVVTEDVKNIVPAESTYDESPASWMESRRLVPRETSEPFLYIRSVETENEKKIILDEYSADITLLTALTSGYQLNTLARVMECLLTDKEADHAELLEKAELYTAKILTDVDTSLLVPETAQRFYEEIRPIDAFCCANRLRGVSFGMR